VSELFLQSCLEFLGFFCSLSGAHCIDPTPPRREHRLKGPSDKGKLEAIRGRKATGLDGTRRDSRVAEEVDAVLL
jgi:hypothetical protein